MSTAGLQAMTDVFSSNHPCQRYLAKFSAVFVFVSTTVMDDARQRLLQPKRPARSTNAMDAVCDAWLRLRGVARAPSSAELVDTDPNSLLLSGKVLTGLSSQVSWWVSILTVIQLVQLVS